MKAVDDQSGQRVRHLTICHVLLHGHSRSQYKRERTFNKDMNFRTLDASTSGTFGPPPRCGQCLASGAKLWRRVAQGPGQVTNF